MADFGVMNLDNIWVTIHGLKLQYIVGVTEYDIAAAPYQMLQRMHRLKKKLLRPQKRCLCTLFIVSQGGLVLLGHPSLSHKAVLYNNDVT